MSRSREGTTAVSVWPCAVSVACTGWDSTHL
ncbi:hypothetical protein QF034_000266 [Streptomyces africanus]|uniref:Uncharacterized protein n=1 Tax=Streptomyces africanus TaxID=231024 RepID=A0ABU0QGF9_9ACTN|nr:hypothetical protein [Streptomyces africanus]